MANNKESERCLGYHIQMKEYHDQCMGKNRSIFGQIDMQCTQAKWKASHIARKHYYECVKPYIINKLS